jgi:hypothetical protein
MEAAEMGGGKNSSEDEIESQNESIEKKKKEKKKKKSKKRRRTSSDEIEHQHSDNQSRPEISNNSLSVGLALENADGEIFQPPTSVSLPAKSKSDFFEKLLAQEKSKPPVGTFHAVGKKTSDMQSAEASKDWTCPKCSTSNYRHSHQCQKCKAIKRLTEWR